MSTFNGVVHEFPDITIDYFRHLPGRRPPLAAFLSHVHSDHLQGLEGFRSPFVYCSLPTKEILLRLEKYPARMLFEQGISECTKRTYKHLRNLLKPIPLDTPTEIELSPKRSIRVTLLDANHCIGAVMFLIEHVDKAILYTGDIRSEPWWVNSLVRNPVVLPYATGLKRLDRIYLDTTFATKDDIHRQFPTKAAGLHELLKEVAHYPQDSIFHFNAWTLGYEDVWVALSNILQSQVCLRIPLPWRKTSLGHQIHVDQYKCRLYKSLSTTEETSSSHNPVLSGFAYANKHQPGCLTSEENVRLHSCERGTRCSVLGKSRVIYITPIISRSNDGEIIPEVGAGGGIGDLKQAHVELDFKQAACELVETCKEKIYDLDMRQKTLDILNQNVIPRLKSISMDLLDMDVKDGMEFLDEITASIAMIFNPMRNSNTFSLLNKVRNQEVMYGAQNGKLPQSISFPYSRHSSYEELRHLVEAFKPHDVYPCTIDEDTWCWDVSMENLFGDICYSTVFAHDKQTVGKLGECGLNSKARRDTRSSQNTLSSRESSIEVGDSHDTDVHQHRKYSNAHIPRLGDPDGTERASKRQRVTSPLTSSEEAASGISSHSSSPSRKLRNVRQSFEGYQARSTRETYLLDPYASGHIFEGLGGMTTPSSSSSVFATAPEETTPVTKDTANRAAGKVANPDEGGAENFLLNSMPGPEEARNDSQSGPETQLTLSDAAFDSQLSVNNDTAKTNTKLHARKEAYKAAKEQNGRWEVDHGLVASCSGHGKEEFEL